MVNSVYIHIPFCRQKCHYCSFVSFCNLSLKKDYLKALKKEITEKYDHKKLETLYFGGGTPSVLNECEVENILKEFNFDKNTEITFELNPQDGSLQFLKSLYNLGINRLSIGVQSFNDNILNSIGRKHNCEDIFWVLKNAREAGFKNISIDLIYGLPEQDLNEWEKTLETAIKLNIQHISLYGLKIEEGCYFYKNPPKNIGDDDLQALMYKAAAKRLSDFEHYEISNFAKGGFISRHNSNYWNASEYLGLGVGASGYIDGVRYTNAKNIKEYIKNPLSLEMSEKLSLEDKLSEAIFLGFRQTRGINIKKINTLFNIDFEIKYSKILKKYIDLGHILRAPKGYKLSIEGVLISNYILCDFI